MSYCKCLLLFRLSLLVFMQIKNIWIDDSEGETVNTWTQRCSEEKQRERRDSESHQVRKPDKTLWVVVQAAGG